MTHVDARERFPVLLRCMPLILVSIPAGCATPGPADYAAAAADYARQAQTHDALARQHEAAAKILEMHAIPPELSGRALRPRMSG